MGSESSDAFEVTKAPLFPDDIKVHSLMCTELIKLVDGVSSMFEKIEAAKPRGSNAITYLCLLNRAINKANLLIQHCKEFSKLYLALTGDVIATRCERTKNQMEQSLSELQNMVPVALAAEISRTISNLRGVVLRLDRAEQDAGKVLQELVQLNLSSANSSAQTVDAFQVALLTLHISSKKEILIEKRSIERQREKVAATDLNKKNVLSFLQRLLD